MKLIFGTDDSYIEARRHYSEVAVVNQGNQCFTTTAYYMLFSQAAFRHSVIGRNLDNFRTITETICLDNRFKTRLSSLLWNVFATENEDRDYNWELLGEVSRHLADRQQHDQSEFLRLFLQQLLEVNLKNN